MINGRWKAYYGLENSGQLMDFGYGIINNFSLRLFSFMLIYIDVKYSEIGRWKISKMSLDERIYHFCDTKRVEDENHFLLDCPTYTHIRSHFQNIDHTTSLPNLLTQQKYCDLGKLLLMLFKYRNKILKNHK